MLNQFVILSNLNTLYLKKKSSKQQQQIQLDRKDNGWGSIHWRIGLKADALLNSGWRRVRNSCRWPGQRPVIRTIAATVALVAFFRIVLRQDVRFEGHVRCESRQFIDIDVIGKIQIQIYTHVSSHWIG